MNEGVFRAFVEICFMRVPGIGEKYYLCKDIYFVYKAI